MNALRWINAIRPAKKFSFEMAWLQKQDDDDDKQKSQMAAGRVPSCRIADSKAVQHNMKVESAGSSSHRMKKNVERNEQLLPTPCLLLSWTKTHDSLSSTMFCFYDHYDNATLSLWLMAYCIKIWKILHNERLILHALTSASNHSNKL